MSILREPSLSLQKKKALFIHNWRTSGTSLNSIFSSNFGRSFAKIGDPFSFFGWPDISLESLRSASDIHRFSPDASIVGGHLAAGVEALVDRSSPWCLWVSVRDPIERIKSGILRFHAASVFKDIGCGSSGCRQFVIDDVCLRHLLENELSFECNAIAKRLVGFLPDFECFLDPSLPLEDLIKKREYNSDHLLEDALEALPRVEFIFLHGHLHASLLSLEQKYTLPPLVNLFSDARHNSWRRTIAGEYVFTDSSEKMLREYNRVDLRLWPKFVDDFRKQLKQFPVTKKAVLARELLHAFPVVDPRIVLDGCPESDLVEMVSRKISSLIHIKPGCKKHLVDAVCGWSRFSNQAVNSIHESLQRA